MFVDLFEKILLIELKESNPSRLFFYDTEFIEEPNTIELISIGIVSEDDREFYAVSNEFDYEKAESDEWLKDNVLSKLPPSEEWVSLESIRERLLEFLKPSEDDPVELWAHYPAYDHVVLCWLFGRMIDLPKGMPKQTNDTRQLREMLGDPELPPEKDEHDALSDARWCKEAYDFLKQLELKNV